MPRRARRRRRVRPSGELLSWTVVRVDVDDQPLDTPVTYGLVKLDGADTALLHRLVDVDGEPTIGDRVRPFSRPNGTARSSTSRASRRRTASGRGPVDRRDPDRLGQSLQRHLARLLGDDALDTVDGLLAGEDLAALAAPRSWPRRARRRPRSPRAPASPRPNGDRSARRARTRSAGDRRAPLDLGGARERDPASANATKKPSPGAMDLLAGVALETPAERLVVPPKEVTPRLVPDRLHQRRRPTMSVNMNVRTSRERAGPATLRAARRRALQLGHRPETLERRPRRGELELGRLDVTVRHVRFRQ